MAKLVAYICDQDECRHELEEIFKDTEDQPEDMGKCPECSKGILKRCNRKRNSQCWRADL